MYRVYTVRIEYRFSKIDQIPKNDIFNCMCLLYGQKGSTCRLTSRQFLSSPMAREQFFASAFLHQPFILVTPGDGVHPAGESFQNITGGKNVKHVNVKEEM